MWEGEKRKDKKKGASGTGKGQGVKRQLAGRQQKNPKRGSCEMIKGAVRIVWSLRKAKRGPVFTTREKKKPADFGREANKKAHRKQRGDGGDAAVV